MRSNAIRQLAPDARVVVHLSIAPLEGNALACNDGYFLDDELIRLPSTRFLMVFVYGVSSVAQKLIRNMFLVVSDSLIYLLRPKYTNTAIIYENPKEVP